MAETLTISGGGSTLVATDELLATAQDLRRLAGEAAGITQELAEIDRRAGREWLYERSASMAAGSAEDALQTAHQLAGLIEAPVTALHHALNLAMEGYGFAESVAERWMHDAAGNLAGTAGFLIRHAPWVLGLAAPLLPLAAGAGTAAAIGLMIAHGGPEGAANAVLSDPAFVSLVRLIVSSADEAALGAMGVPMPFIPALSDDGVGLVGMGTVAGGILAGGAAAGLTRESRVQLQSKVITTGLEPAQGFAERVDRIPPLSKGDAVQVVVERYSTPGQPDRFEVFIAGTMSWDVGASTEPWDTTSNLGNAAGDQSASVRAVQDAMDDAGIKPGSPVLLTGYSQGGAVAAIITASGVYDVHGVNLFGGNTGHVRIPQEIPTVLVEHTDDIVPASGGVQRNLHAIVVERQAMAGQPLPEGEPVPAHRLSRYKETAELMDEARSDQLTGAAQRLADFTAGRTVTRTEYTYARDREPRAGGVGV